MTDRRGRIKVNSDLSIPGHPEISVIGDDGSSSVEGAGVGAPTEADHPFGLMRGVRTSGCIGPLVRPVRRR